MAGFVKKTNKKTTNEEGTIGKGGASICDNIDLDGKGRQRRKSRKNTIDLYHLFITSYDTCVYKSTSPFKPTRPEWTREREKQEKGSH